jgi:hypothetical protein
VHVAAAENKTVTLAGATITQTDCPNAIHFQGSSSHNILRGKAVAVITMETTAAFASSGARLEWYGTEMVVRAPVMESVVILGGAITTPTVESLNAMF